MIWLHRYATLVAASTVLLIAAGAMVTSTGSGLAVPDWPTAYGWFMFSFPRDKWVGGIFYEHGHRVIASTVGFLTILLAAWTWRVDPRAWVRRLGVAALGAVILQGLLGGVTVLLFLPPPVSIAHAALAQLFFCTTVSLALFTSRGWRETPPPADDPALRRLAAATTTIVFFQILLGATMRHTGAGMAIPTFPLAFGHVIPPQWSWPVAIHFAHRLGALVVLAAIAATAFHVRHRSARRDLARPAALLVVLVLTQAALGAWVVLSGLQPFVNTLHVVNGALVLGASLVLTLRSFKPVLDGVMSADSTIRRARSRFEVAGSDLAGSARGAIVKAGTDAVALPDARSRANDFLALAKPRLNFLVVASSLAGDVMGGGAISNAALVVCTVFGTALVAGGASAFNQVIEREPDSLMRRTRLRPVPDGRLQPAESLLFATVMSIAGLVILAVGVNVLSAGVALTTLVTYAAIYTPLKRRSSFSTVVGAIPGALPPVIGWAAARDGLSQGAWVLFAILFLWQLPHFLAIAWIHREDYARAGFPMLPVIEPDGRSTGRQAIIYCAALLPVSLAPTLVGMTGTAYFVTALVLTLLFLGLTIRFARTREIPDARRLFFGSIIYLPILWILMIAGRV